MSKVWYAPLTSHEDGETIGEKVVKLFDEAGFANLLTEEDLVAIKIHFGEKNNTGYIKPDYIRSLLQKVKALKVKPFLTDTNTLYRGERTNSIDHLMQAYEHGFSIENLGVPVIIADGLLSRNHRDIPVEANHFETVALANDIVDSDAIMVMSHLTGHILTGMGAAVKNLGMGAASRSGKQKQHADVKPVVREDRCTTCGSCIRRCPVDAISYIKEIAYIDHQICYGCAECVAACRFGAVRVPESSSNTLLQEKMAEYALGVYQDKQDKICFFNFLTHITKECDCIAKAQDKIIGDIGILASYDPIAIDKASVDLLLQRAEGNLLKEIWPENDYKIQLAYGESLGLGSLQYELIQVS